MKLILPDGKELELQDGLTGKEVATSLAVSLGKSALAYSLNGELYDINRPITASGHFAIITNKSIEARDILNHSTSHLLAQAMKHLYPNVKMGFGPSIEDGFYYDFDLEETITEEDLAKIEKEMHQIAKSGLKIEREEVTKEQAKEIFKDNSYKLELIDGAEGTISLYRQGDFVDLCRGPHLPNTSMISHFKLLSIAGAYWRGDSSNKQLLRIYGTSFFSDVDLKTHLTNLEERKKRDHRRIGKDLGLFMISDYGPGFPFWLPNGLVLRKNLENFWYELHTRNGYQFIQTPIMLSKELWEISGHWFNYRENMYTSKIDDKEFAIKPMNCPGGILVYNSTLHSYKDLPLRLGELGLVHRHEASGALAGLFRVRTFTQDDAHIFIREDQIVDEVKRIIKLYDYVYSIFNLDYHIELSTRPEKKYIGDIAIWNKAEKALAEACETSGREYKINPGDGAFYGPKLDFKLKDSMGRIWQCGTIQLDMNLPERFDCTYIDQNNEKVRPIMLHRALFGSIERFIGIITEHFYGAFPTWLAPVQVNLLPIVNDLHMAYSQELKDKFFDAGLRVKIDNREEKVGYRLRESQMMKIPYTLVVGDKEVSEKVVTYRKYGTQEQITVSIDEFIAMVQDEVKSKKLLQSK